MEQGVEVTELTEVEDSDEDYLPPEDQRQEVVMKTFVAKQEVKKPAAAVADLSPGVPSIPCPQCDKMFMRGYNMRVHIDRVHNKHKPWQCQFCEKSFATTSDLKQHLSR